MKRKIFAIVMTTLMLTQQLCSCGAAAKEDSGASGSDGASALEHIFTGELEKNVTIQVLENDTAIEKGYFDELISAFNETYKDQGITAVDANMNQYLDLANDGPYGYGPDVLYQANDVIMQYAQGKHIYPLPIESMECYKQIPQTAWDAYKTNQGGVDYYCGIPVNVQAPMLYYRADLLPDDWETSWDDDKDGVPDMVQNWNDMYAFSIERHKEDPAEYGYMKSVYDVYFSSGFLFSYGGYVFGQNNTDASDIGFSAGKAEKGAWVLEQLAGVMNEECIDDTITTNAYSKLADGTYFATISTPDVYSTFLDELVAEYKSQGLDDKEAEDKAKENLVMASLPKLPESGDLTEESPKLIDSKTMGGINGYAISAYTKYPNACLAFIDFATSYEMMVKRSDMLGVAPAREDAAQKAGGTSQLLYENLEKGNITLMPSIEEVSQIWTPGRHFLQTLQKMHSVQKKRKNTQHLKI